VVPLACPLLGNRRVHRVARQEQDRWAALCPPPGSTIPGGDPHLIEAVIKYLEHLDIIRRAQGFWDHLRGQWDRLHLVQYTLPKRLKVHWLVRLRPIIGTYLFRHSCS